MKKIFLLFTALLLFTACGKEPAPPANDIPAPVSTGPSGPPTISEPTSPPPA